MKISVNCPSYRRPKVKTLAYLPFTKVWVSEDEFDDYVKANPGFEKNIIKCPREKQGNVSRIRNWILDNELKENDVVVIIDDDLEGIYSFEKNPKNNFGYEKKLIDASVFLLFIEKYTIMTEELGFKMWGVNCNGDAMSYRHYSPFSTLSIVLGPFSAYLSGSEPRYDEKLPLKEDYDMFIQHMSKYRGVLRVNGVHYMAKQSEQAGGCATYRNYERERQQLIALRKKWGSDIVKVDKSNKGHSKKQKLFDYNPIIKIPIKGI
jgi:hypothetical protein